MSAAAERTRASARPSSKRGRRLRPGEKGMSMPTERWISTEEHGSQTKLGERGLSRRTLIQAVAAGGGGLLLSFTLPGLSRCAEAEAPAAGKGYGGPPNAYVRIDGDNAVTMIVPRVEMGQGTYTSLPMLIAEELEVDLDRVTVEAAPPAPEVYGFAVDPTAPEGIEKDQSTGTSLSIIQCWTPLRQAGATARLMLIEAAARRWRVPPGSCQAQRGVVLHSPSGRRLSYGELATAAAALPQPP